MRKSEIDVSVFLKKQPMKPIRADTKYVSVDELAIILDVSKDTVYQLLRAGKLDGAFKLNRMWRIPVV